MQLPFLKELWRAPGMELKIRVKGTIQEPEVSAELIGAPQHDRRRSPEGQSRPGRRIGDTGP